MLGTEPIKSIWQEEELQFCTALINIKFTESWHGMVPKRLFYESEVLTLIFIPAVNSITDHRSATSYFSASVAWR